MPDSEPSHDQEATESPPPPRPPQPPPFDPDLELIGYLDKGQVPDSGQGPEPD
jgi:hypothetical protein